MRVQKHHFARNIAVPLRHATQRASLWVLALCCLILIVLGKHNNPVVGNLRVSISDIFTPVLTVISSPMQAASDVVRWTRELSALRSENAALKNENIQLKQWQRAAKSLEIENRSLRGLIKAVPPSAVSYVAARIVGQGGGPYSYSALINAGTNDGVARDQAVVNQEGLVGRVIEVGLHSARVLLLRDFGLRVPVMGERSRERAIMAGDHTDSPQLMYLSSHTQISEGERLVTSGDGGVFPAGIPVGVVHIDDEAGVRVQPFADWSRLEYVNVVNFSF